MRFFTAIIIASLTYLTLPSYSQGIINNGAAITIQAGAYVHVDGDGNGGYLNQTSGTDGSIDLNGILEVEGNWTNNATGAAAYVLINTTPQNGTVLLTGNSSTNMNGTKTTRFENLTISKVGAGLSVTLGLDQTVLGTLTLTNGVFTTGVNNMIVTNTASTSITGHSQNSFVNGNLRRYVANGISPYPLPVGNGTAITNYHLAEIVNYSHTLVSFINASFSTVTQPSLTLSELGSPYAQAEGRWLLRPDVNPGGGSFNVRLYKMNLPSANYLDNQFAVIQRDVADAAASDWDCTPCGVGNPGLPANGSVGRMAADAYALRQGMTFDVNNRVQFAIGTIVNPLPIDLLKFVAKCNDGKIEISWETSSEKNNDYFTVEKSIDAINYDPLQIVNGAGNSNSLLHYNVTDENSIDGYVFYKLKQTDFDGKSSYSDKIAVNCSWSSFSILSLFNSGNELNIVFTGIEGETFILNVYDDNGRLIAKKSDKIYSGLNEINIDLNRVSSSIYLVSLSNNKEHISQKVMRINKTN